MFVSAERRSGWDEKKNRKIFFLFLLVFLSSYVLFQVTDSGESEMKYRCLLKLLIMIDSYGVRQRRSLSGSE